MIKQVSDNVACRNLHLGDLNCVKGICIILFKFKESTQRRAPSEGREISVGFCFSPPCLQAGSGCITGHFRIATKYMTVKTN